MKKQLKLFNNNFFKYQLIILVGIFLLLDAYILCQLYKSWQHITIADKNSLPYPNYIISPKKTTQTAEKLAYPLVVVIDNHIEARPNYGLSLADIVYEVPVEGEVTRFLAIYNQQNTKVDKIGPIRSVRPYMVEIAKEYDGLLAHAGGSPQALELIKQLKVHNLEEISWQGPKYFWRIYSRTAPHNLFTSFKKLLAALSDLNLNKTTTIYRRQTKPNMKHGQTFPATNIKILFSTNKAYQVTYQYQNETKKYLRLQNQQKQVDELNNKQITIDNLIVQFIPPKKIIDKTGRLKLDLLGQGKAVIFSNGQARLAKWIKTNSEQKTVFYDQTTKEEINFKPGNVWIEVVPQDIKVKW